MSNVNWAWQDYSELDIKEAHYSAATEEKLGLPPYLEKSMSMGGVCIGLSNILGMIQGVNYAYAAADILSSSGFDLDKQ